MSKARKQQHCPWLLYSLRVGRPDHFHSISPSFISQALFRLPPILCAQFSYVNTGQLRSENNYHTVTSFSSRLLDGFLSWENIKKNFFKKELSTTRKSKSTSLWKMKMVLLLLGRHLTIVYYVWLRFCCGNSFYFNFHVVSSFSLAATREQFSLWLCIILRLFESWGCCCFMQPLPLFLPDRLWKKGSYFHLNVAHTAILQLGCEGSFFLLSLDGWWVSGDSSSAMTMLQASKQFKLREGRDVGSLRVGPLVFSLNHVRLLFRR